MLLYNNILINNVHEDLYSSLSLTNLPEKKEENHENKIHEKCPGH